VVRGIRGKRQVVAEFPRESCLAATRRGARSASETEQEHPLTPSDAEVGRRGRKSREGPKTPAGYGQDHFIRQAIAEDMAVGQDVAL